MPSRIRIRGKESFQLAALGALTGTATSSRAAQRLSRLGYVASRPTVGTFREQAFPILAKPSVTIKRPADLGVVSELFLFRRRPATVPWLARQLKKDPSIVRIDRLRGEYQLCAEVLCSDNAELDSLVERFEPDLQLLIQERSDRVRRGLLRVAARARELGG